MLKHRLITASILIPLVIWGIFGLSTPFFALFLALVIFIGAWEWTQLVGLHAKKDQITFFAGLVILLLLSLLIYQVFTANIVLLFACIWWFFAIKKIKTYRGETGIDTGKKVDYAVSGYFILVPAWLAFVELHATEDIGALLVLYVMILVWVADTGAYFSGRKWGKTKLAPEVSPGKSREGVYGAMGASTLFAFFASGWFDFNLMQYIIFILLSVVVVVFSVIGDLTESLYKRIAEKKDSGSLLPGHGGVLDRIDSLTAAAPIFALGFVLVEKFS